MNDQTKKAVAELRELITDVATYNSYHHPTERVCKGDIALVFQALITAFTAELSQLKEAGDAMLKDLGKVTVELEAAQREIDRHLATNPASLRAANGAIRNLLEEYENKMQEAQRERDQAKAKLAEAGSKNDLLRRELFSHREKAQGNYWAWQAGGDDYLESQVYPVLIHAKDLKAIVDKLAVAIQLYEAAKLDAAAELHSRQEYQQAAFDLQAKLAEAEACIITKNVDLRSILDERERLRKALEFYADDKSYDSQIAGYEMIAPIESDRGRIAREALAPAPEEKK